MKNKIIEEGIHNFPENSSIINRRRTPVEMLVESNPRYHGDKSPECLLVKCRREEIYREHYLDVYMCLSHMKETCRCGWERHWHGGEYSLNIK